MSDYLFALEQQRGQNLNNVQTWIVNDTHQMPSETAGTYHDSNVVHFENPEMHSLVPSNEFKLWKHANNELYLILFEPGPDDTARWIITKPKLNDGSHEIRFREDIPMHQQPASFHRVYHVAESELIRIEQQSDECQLELDTFRITVQSDLHCIQQQREEQYNRLMVISCAVGLVLVVVVLCLLALLWKISHGQKKEVPAVSAGHRADEIENELPAANAVHHQRQNILGSGPNEFGMKNVYEVTAGEGVDLRKMARATETSHGAEGRLCETFGEQGHE